MVLGKYSKMNIQQKEFVMKYDFAAIESKWQKKWEETKPYAAITGDPRPKSCGI